MMESFINELLIDPVVLLSDTDKKPQCHFSNLFGGKGYLGGAIFTRIYLILN